MARNYQRSIRLDETLRSPVESLPYGTLNSLVNQLLNLFFDDKDVQEKVTLADSRFKDWEPKKLVPVTAPLPGQVALDDVIEEEPPEPVQHESLDDFLPGL